MSDKIMKNYFIKNEYKVRLDNLYCNQEGCRDEHQKEVYLLAKHLAKENNFSKIVDIGAGSGFKLIKNFGNKETLGIDLTSTVDWLKNKYPNRHWSDKFEPVEGYDMIICADIIEHIPDPDILLDLIEKFKSKLIVLSTADRDMLTGTRFESPNGPPINPCHVREWNSSEFKQYISSRFDVIEHKITNKHQCTQTIVAKRKN